MLDRLLMGAADDKQFVEDVFSTWLYTGNGAAQTITNGIDLAGKGGMVWLKMRSTAQNHYLTDSARGLDQHLSTNTTAAQSALDTFTFLSNGVTIPSSFSTSPETYASWTFRKAPKFFDIVTYTGDGTSSRVISHSLGITPGFIVIKSTSGTSDWSVYHRSLSAGAGGYLNTTNQLNLSIGISADASTFSLTGTARNALGTTYVVYLYAHDASSDGLIQCGTYTGTGLAGQIATLGWEPQWVMIKAINTATDWHMYDNMRGMTTLSDGTVRLLANTSGAESGPFGGASSVFPTATGFGAGGGLDGVNQSGGNYVYIAIRRGPMRTPTLGTSVLSIKNYAATFSSASVTHDVTFDAELNANRDAVIDKFLIVDSLRGINGGVLATSGTSSEAAYPTYWSRNGQRGMRAPTNFDGWWASSAGTNNHISYGLVRAPGFFDVVCYTGAGGNTPINHSLGVIPELVIIKTRSTSGTDWRVAIADPSWASFNTQFSGNLNSTAALVKNTSILNTVTTTSALITQGGNDAVTGRTYVMYLFASCFGVSKVGKYTGNGSSQTVNCNFSSGARFVMIKRTDSTGDWYVWDTTRGIIAGNDPHLSFNSTAVEVTTDDTIDPDSSGFVVNQVAATNVNVSAATYIYLAIA